jgi:hypothetical protein
MPGAFPATGMALGDPARQVCTATDDRVEEPHERANRAAVWHVCGTTGSAGRFLLSRRLITWAVTWNFGLERAKGIEPS